MQNNYSRRDFIRTTAVAVGVGGLMGASSGCGKDFVFAIPASVMNGIGKMSYTSTIGEYNQKQAILASGTNFSRVQESGQRIEKATKD